MKEQRWSGALEKIDDYHWRIPQTYERGMRVPGMIIADERLLKDITSDQSLQQVANVAHLPGIVKASMAMPDIHWGYGAPIGGVAAFDPEAGGTVSPGMVGYDINCLTGDSAILHAHGYLLPIRAFDTSWPKQRIQCFAGTRQRLETTGLRQFLVSCDRRDVFLLTTATGKSIQATADHPFLTPNGMRRLADLRPDDTIAVVPGPRIEYESPKSAIIVTHEHVLRLTRQKRYRLSEQRAQRLVGRLKARKLLPLTYNHPSVPDLLKIMGMVFGDGSMNFIGTRQDGVIHFAGRAEDLETIRTDVEALGYTPGPIHWRISRLRYQGEVHQYRNASFVVNAASLVVLLAALGVPIGTKVAQRYRVPEWLWRAPLWQQRLFLGALFGAELTRPRPRHEKRGNFCAPAFSMNKAHTILENGVKFLEDIARLVENFGVKTSTIQVRRDHIGRRGLRTRYLELVFSPSPESLNGLWGRVGYIYHREKAALAGVALQYLALKTKAIRTRRLPAAQIHQLHQCGQTHAQVHAEVGSRFVNLRYVQSVVQRGTVAVEPRIPKTFPSYEEFRQLVTIGLEGTGVVWDAIEAITPVPETHRVYDFTVDHTSHNFVANGFVVHNCGVRLVRTDLTVEEVQSKLRTLIASLFDAVPCGVGMSGDIRVSRNDAPRLMTQGSRWVIQQGYGAAADVGHTESQGCLPDADPGAVSDRALQRGHDQLGTLGSGNHFLEVQAVDTIYDEQAANAFGLFPNQVTVMIHSGSRGFGYQICDDYLDVTGRAMAKYGISVPDRQLACAPINSEEGRAYLGAMRCAANYAWANRQCLMHLTRLTFERAFGRSWEQLGMQLVYDVAHNIAKFERHTVDGTARTVCVHRKGATRAFPPGHPEVPEDYQPVGQPVIIPGDMGRNSYVLAGTQTAMEETFGTCCHGAGRVMSRTEAVRKASGRSIEGELEQKGIIVMGRGRKGVAEEQPDAYKDVNEVVRVVHNAGLAKRVARMRPLGVIKG